VASRSARPWARESGARIRSSGAQITVKGACTAWTRLQSIGSAKKSSRSGKWIMGGCGNDHDARDGSSSVPRPSVTEDVPGPDAVSGEGGLSG